MLLSACNRQGEKLRRAVSALNFFSLHKLLILNRGRETAVEFLEHYDLDEIPTSW